MGLRDRLPDDIESRLQDEVDSLVEQMDCDHDGGTTVEEGSELCGDCGAFLGYADPMMDEFVGGGGT